VQHLCSNVTVLELACMNWACIVHSLFATDIVVAVVGLSTGAVQAEQAGGYMVAVQHEAAWNGCFVVDEVVVVEAGIGDEDRDIAEPVVDSAVAEVDTEFVTEAVAEGLTDVEDVDAEDVVEDDN
jgi:hypothetical protein